MSMVKMFCLLSIMSGTVYAEESDIIRMDDVTVTKLSGDSDSSNFSTLFNFTVGDKAKFDKDWQIGFYMPRSFLQSDESHGNYNPELLMNLCVVESNLTIPKCINMNIVKTSITHNDKSQGTLTVLQPESIFVLSPNTKYKMSIKHSNQYLPHNYAEVPQSIFLTSGGVYWNVPTNRDTYKFPMFESASSKESEEKYLLDNWKNSAQYKSNDDQFMIVPSVVMSEKKSGVFVLKDGLVIHDTIAKSVNELAQLQIYLSKELNLKTKYDYLDHSIFGDILIKQIKTPQEINNNPEGYKITISKEQIKIEVISRAGLFYATQTLRQLWYKGKEIPNGVIVDYPRFKYRGVLVDVARHFLSVNDLKHIVDILATHKINTMHLHLSDDEAFRLGLNDINTDLSSSRGGDNSLGAAMLVQQSLDKTYNDGDNIYPQADISYNGFYTKNNITDLIKYANSQQITVIPELDFPGHARALIKSNPNLYANLSDTSKYISVQGYTDDVLAVCRYRKNQDFTKSIDRVVNETVSWFKKQNTLYALNNEISLGGDEVAKTAWSEDLECVESKLNTLNSLEKTHLFFNNIAANNPNLYISGWQQFVQNEDDTLGVNIVSPGRTGHVWVWNISGLEDGSNTGIKQAINLSNNKYSTVLAFADKAYFDIAYAPNINEYGFVWSTPNSDTHSALSIVSAVAKIQELDKNSLEHIDGLEGTLWSENLPGMGHIEYMLVPKLAGLSEAAWSSGSSTYDDNKLNWQSLSSRLGCGFDGKFLDYIASTYKVTYRGYPNGISLEAPLSCVK